MPQSHGSCRNNITCTSHPSALTERHTAPGSPEGESLAIVPITSRETMVLWPYRGAVLSPMSAQNQRQSGMCPSYSCLMCWMPQSGTSSACLHIPERDKRRLQTVYAGQMGLGHPTACTLPESPRAGHPTNSFPWPMLASAPLRYRTAAPFRRRTCSLGLQPGHSSIGVFHFHTLLFLLIPPSHQSGTDRSSPVLSLQHWGGIGGDLQFLVPTAFITPSPFLRKEISHEPQWKSQRSTKGVEFKV